MRGCMPLSFIMTIKYGTSNLEIWLNPSVRPKAVDLIFYEND